MSKATIIVGLDGGEAGNRALTFACGQAKLIGDCALKLVYVIEWSPFSFQTSEENEQRHKRREEELSQARTRIMDPAVKEVTDSGLAVEGIVRHGDVADILRVSDLLCMSNLVHASLTKEHEDNDDYEGSIRRAAERR